MSSLELIQNLPENFKNFENNYSGATDISKVLDLTIYKDDLDGLIEEMERQPAVYAYWSNLKRIANEKLSKLEEDYDTWKASKLKVTMERLSMDGAKAPTGKMIDAKFTALYSKDELNKKFKTEIKFWKRRYDMLCIVERSIESRKEQFRSLSFLLSNMMSSGILTVSKKSAKTLKQMEV
jgi:hypothetical protein